MRLLLSIFVVLLALTIWSLIDKEIPPLVKPLAPSPDADEGKLLDIDAEESTLRPQTTQKDVQKSNLSVYAYDELTQLYISDNLTQRFENFGKHQQKEILYKYLPEISDAQTFDELGPHDIRLFCFLVHEHADRSHATPQIIERVEKTNHIGGTILLGLLHSDDAFAHTFTTEEITLGDKQISCIHFFAPYELASEKLSKIV